MGDLDDEFDEDFLDGIDDDDFAEEVFLLTQDVASFSQASLFRKDARAALTAASTAGDPQELKFHLLCALGAMESAQRLDPSDEVAETVGQIHGLLCATSDLLQARGE